MAVSSFSGLASGIDTASIVTQLVKLEHGPIDRLQQKQTDLQAQSKKFSTLKDLLVTLRGAADGMNTRKDVLTSKATSSDDKVLTATALGGASLGSFELEVTKIASAQRNYSENFATKDQAGLIFAGSLTIQVGAGTPLTIETDGNSTLESVVSSINSSGAGVTAGLLFTGGQYRIQVTAKDTGAANAVTFGGDNAAQFGFANYEMRPAEDAVFSIDDIPMTSATNAIGTAIDGVTFTLKGVTTGTTITVGRDDTAIKAKLQTFVDAYNAVSKQLNAEFAFTGSAQTGATLSGDSTLRTIQSKLRGLLGSEATGVTGDFTTLASIGLKLQNDGTVKIDDEKLTAVLATNPEAISTLLIANPSAGTVGVFGQFSVAIKDMVSGTDGPIAQRITGIAARVKDMTAQMDRMEASISKFEENLKTQFAAMEAVMSRLQSQGNQLAALLSGLNT